VDDRGDLRPIAWAISGVVGLFVVVVAAAWVWSHVVRGDPLDAVALIILGATLLRIGTLLVAWAAVCRWGRRLPQGPLVGALWGCALAQLVYPVAELVVKLLVLTRIVPSGTGGVRNMSAVGWGNFAAAAVVFGVPGALFAVLGHRVRVRRQVPARWAWIGGAGGVVALGLIGVAIGS
jgi:hypothetical protein